MYYKVEFSNADINNESKNLLFVWKKNAYVLLLHCMTVKDDILLLMSLY